MSKSLQELKVGHKLAIVVVLAVLAAVPPTMLFVQQSSEAVAAARLEESGLGPTRRALDLLQRLQLHRAASVRTLSGGGDPVQRDALAGQVSTAAAALDGALERSVAGESLTSAWASIRREWEALHAAIGAGTIRADEAFRRHSALNDEVLKLLRDIATEYSLILDPELVGYNLVYATSIALPELTETLGQVRARGTALLASGAASADDRVALATLYARLGEKSARASEILARPYATSPALRASTEAEERAAQRKTAEAIALARREVVDAAKPADPAADFQRSMTEAIDAQFTLTGAVHAFLVHELEARVARHERTRNLALGLIAALALAAGALAFVIGRGIVSRLRETVAVAESIARGELDRAMAVKGGDEIADLTRAMAKTQDRLREVIGSIRDATGAVSTASRQIASGNSDLSQRTEEQAASLQQTASSIEQLTATVRQNAENAKQANQLATSTSEVAAHGGEVVGRVVTTMGEIHQASSKIADIIGVIDGIAFQTNILALNAAVEAARAGEQGRGFAVVASEVRTLAQRSSEAAKEIRGLIGRSVDRVASGAALVGEAGKTMGEVVASVQRMTDLMAEITAAAVEQSAGIDQINLAVAQMDQVTQQNAALVEEAAAAAGSMEDQARSLASSVAVFRIAGAQAMARAVVEKAARTPALIPGVKSGAWARSSGCSRRSRRRSASSGSSIAR